MYVCHIIYIYVDPSPRPNTAEDTNQGNQVIPWPAAWYSGHVLVAIHGRKGGTKTDQMMQIHHIHTELNSILQSVQELCYSPQLSAASRGKA